VAIKIQDRVKQGTNTTGSGTITFHVSYASSGFDDFSVLGNGSKTYYAIEEAPSGWEVGIGTYNSNTLSRDTIFDSSEGGAKINLGGSGLVFVTLPASKTVIADENNNVFATGLDVGATGIVFNDGTTQTTAFTGIAGFATEAYVTGVSGHLQTQISSNDSDIAANLAKITGVSGTAVINTSSISTNTTNIAANTIRLADVSGSVDINTAKIGTVSGTADTNTTNIATNTAKIGTVSGTVDTNTTNIASNVTQIVANSGRLATVSGSVDINTAMITGVSGVAVSKDNYQYWTVSDGATDKNVTTTEKITFTGAGNTSVSYSSNVVTISGSSAGGGGDGYDFNVSDGGSADTIASGQTVIWTGLGNNTVSYNSSSNTFSISGADQDLSSYATQSYVTGASGHLQTQITTNVNNISSNDTDISNLSGLVSTNTSNIATVSGIAAGKDNYQYWTITDGPNSENIQSTNIVKFSGEGNTTVSYDTGSNTVSISGAAAGGGGGYDFTVSDGSNSEVISSGDSVTWTGLGNNTVTYNSASNTFSISGTDQDLSSYATQSYVTGASGHLQSQITSNDNDISINLAKVTGVSGTAATNTTNISTNITNISTNTTRLADVSGSVDINTAKIGTVSGTAADNATNIANTSGDLYGHWIISAGAVQENVAKTEKVKFTGTGATTVSYDTGTNTLTVNTPSSEAGYEYWTATDGSANTSSVANGQAVRITGAGNVTVDFASGSPNVFTVSGADQDLSSYATQAYVTGASGHLQTQISSNDSDIASNVTNIAANTARLADVSGSVDINTAMITGVSGTAATNTTNIATNVTNIAANTARLADVSGSVDINTAMITGVSGTAATNTTNIATNVTNIAANTARLGTVSGSVDINTAMITGVSGNLNTVSGLLYTSWTVTDGSNSEAITAGGQVNFTGGGNTTVSYNTSSNTVTISGNDVTNTYNAGSGLNEDPSKTFNVQTDNSTLEVNSDIVRIKDNGVTNAKLANTGVTVTAGTGLTNGGVVALGASVTVDAITASTSAVGVVQLQDTVTDGTTNRAVTPNAVYDMSGVINGNINTYTAGSGLNLDGTEFDVKLDNSTVEFNSDIIQIKDDGVTNAKLANTGVTVTAGTGLTNGGVVALGASVTFDAILATTSGTGVVQLQDAITNGTIDRAVTPNAVYDMSGVINGNINTYTAGSGLNLDGTEFDVKLDNSTLEFNSDIIQIKDAGVSNGKLAYDSVTITAGSGLSNGGEVDLGATKVIDITPGGVTNAMLAGSISESKLASDVNLDAVTDNGATTTNGINVGMIDTSGVRSSMQSGAGSSPGDTRNLDLSQASTFHHSMNSGLNNITLTNVTAGQKFVLRLTQNASATGIVSFFGGVRWPAGTTPTLTATTSKTDVFGFLCVVSGSYDGFIIGQNI